MLGLFSLPVFFFFFFACLFVVLVVFLNSVGFFGWLVCFGFVGAFF